MGVSAIGRVSGGKAFGGKTSGNASLEKGLVLFGKILADRGNTKLALLVEDMELPRSTLHRLTATLEAQGLIARIAHGHYDIDIRLAGLIENVSASAQLAAICRPLLRELAQHSNATTHLGILENDMVTCLVKETGKGPYAAIPFTRENAQLEAYCSGIGKVLLAWLPARERVRYLAGGPFVGLTSQTITNPAKLADQLKVIRIQGFSCDEGEIAENLRCLAVPIWTEPRPMMAAISMAFLKPHGSKKDDSAQLVKLRACATKLRGRLGH